MKEEATEPRDEEAAKQEEEGKGEDKATAEAKKENPVKEKKAEKNAEDAKSSKVQKNMQCKVTLLDDAPFECELDVSPRRQHVLSVPDVRSSADEIPPCVLETR